MNFSITVTESYLTAPWIFSTRQHACASVAVVNYPNEHLYTRVTEFKYLTGQEHTKTSIVYEYPREEGDPYYPVPRPENAELYKKYKALAEASRRTFRGAVGDIQVLQHGPSRFLTIYNQLAVRSSGI